MEIKIYKITNLITKKEYVGQTIQGLTIRFNQHKNDKRRYCRYLSNAILKYGFENFEIKKIDIASSEEEALRLENKYIILYNTLAPNGYNLILETEIKRIPSNETKERMTISKQGNTNAENSLGLIGVRKHRSKFEARITKNYKCYEKLFGTQTEAAEAYDRVVIFLYGPTAKINFIDNLIIYLNEDLASYFEFFKMKRKKSSKYKFVSWQANCKKWRAYFQNKKTQVTLGYFKNEEDAGKAVENYISNGVNNYETKKYTKRL